MLFFIYPDSYTGAYVQTHKDFLIVAVQTCMEGNLKQEVIAPQTCSCSSDTPRVLSSPPQ